MSSCVRRTSLALSIALLGFADQRASGQAEQASLSTRIGRLAPGDDVVVTVFREKDLSAKVYVDDKGQVVLPRLGLIDVRDLTTDMLRDTIRAKYSTFLRDPSIDLRALRRITVNGAVLKP